MKTTKLIFICIGIVALIAICYLGSTLIRGASFGFNNLLTSSDYFIMACTTLAGVVASVLVSGLKQLPQDQRIAVGSLVDMLGRPGALVAFVVSPIAIYGTLAAIGAQEVGLASYLAAFQNGFFWEQVLKQRS
jgi:hypothetical protein